MTIDKRRTDDLAIFGGELRFERTLHVGRPNLGDTERFRTLVDDALERRWLTNDGPYLGEFERVVAERLGVAHCVATCNGTAALEIAIRALDLSGEVIVPSFTFVATPHALEWLGVTPVFCDIEPGRYTLDPGLVEQLITPQTSAIMGVHIWGRPCRIEPLQEIADRHGLPLIFDAAQAFGSSYEGVPLGRFGTAEILSFHATKVINSIEGGAVVTDDDELAERVRRMRSYGFVDVDEVVSVGTNAKMSEISAAMGITSLEAFDRIVELNRANYDAYRDGLAGVSGVALSEFDPGEQRSHHYVVVEIDEAVAGLSRDRIRDLLHAENVLARRYFYPGCHRLEPYRTRPGEMVDSLPVTDGIAARALCLPTGQSVDAETIGQLCGLIRFAVEHSDEIEQRLAAEERAGG